MLRLVRLSRPVSAVAAAALAAVLAGCGSDTAGSPAPGEQAVQGPELPAKAGTCPAMAQGDNQFRGKNVLLHVPPDGSPKGGPLVFYWHGSLSNTGECSLTLRNQIPEITAQGGVVACMDGGQSANDGDYTGPFEWYEGDYAVADEVVACATEKFGIDSKRIHALGMSAGGLQTSQMVLRRSYLASAVSLSGGCLDCREPPDASNKTPVMFFHGSWEADLVVIRFYDTSRNMENKFREWGHFAIDCDHGGGHMVPPEGASMWQFFQDHPYKVQPEPYADGLPDSFPDYCKIVTEHMPLKAEQQ